VAQAVSAQSESTHANATARGLRMGGPPILCRSSPRPLFAGGTRGAGGGVCDAQSVRPSASASVAARPRRATGGLIGPHPLARGGLRGGRGVYLLGGGLRIELDIARHAEQFVHIAVRTSPVDDEAASPPSHSGVASTLQRHYDVLRTTHVPCAFRVRQADRVRLMRWLAMWRWRLRQFEYRDPIGAEPPRDCVGPLHGQLAHDRGGQLTTG
jgi:hypothetical protein